MTNNTFHANTFQTNLRIERSDEQLLLKFGSDTDSDTGAIQSAININRPHRLVMENLRYLMGILLFIPAPQKILLLGVGGGSLVHFLRYYLPAAHLTAVEYDPQLLQIAHDRLYLPQTSNRLSYVIDDARNYVTFCEQRYDLILVDIFEGGRVPGWLLEKPFTERLKNCLSVEGAVAYNVLIDSERGFKRFYQLFRQTYGQQTLCLETDNYENLLIYGLNFMSQKKTMTEYLHNSEPLTQQYDLPFSRILSVIYNINPVDSGII